MVKRIGILGFGSVGQFLVAQIQHKPKIASQLEIAFVWNRSAERLQEAPLPKEILYSGNLQQAWKNIVEEVPALDLVIEVAHPAVVQALGATILEHCNLLVSSVTAFADPETEKAIRKAATRYGVYIPAGAGWGLADIAKMASMETLKGLSIKMAFHATALKLEEPLKKKLDDFLASEQTDPLTLFEGPIREVAALAPNNVNTMTAVALAGSTLGLDATRGTLVAQKAHDAHLVEILIQGPDGFWVQTTRHNPAKKGAVTGAQTYYSFLYSLLQAGGQGPGWHFC